MEKRRMEAAEVHKLKNNFSILPFGNILPKIHTTVFIADGARIIGDVEIKKNSSVWYNTVIRGDVHYIRIGEMTNIQDCSMLHVTNGKFPLNIGNKVTVGHSVKLHGCTLQDLCLIGIGAIVLDGVVVEERSFVAAGSVVTPRTIVPSGKLVAGVPAKIVRDLTQEEINDIEESALRYKKYVEKTVESLKQNDH